MVNLLVQVSESHHPWNWHEMAPPEATDFSFHPSFFVGSRKSRSAEHRIEAIVRPHRYEALGLCAQPAAHDPHDRRFQVVVSDDRRDAPEVLESTDMTIQEGFLGFVPIPVVKRFPRSAQPHNEEVAGHKTTV